MIAHALHHAYNEVVAPHYDLDPQGVTGQSLDRAVQQLRKQPVFTSGTNPFRVLDLGMGTGMFLSKLKVLGGPRIVPYGLDLAENMVANARLKLPDLVADVDDAANFDNHFMGQKFDCVCTHFVTGFVPMRLLAPKIWSRLEEGGYWSFVGGTKGGFPELQRKANSKLLRWWYGARSREMDEAFINPADLGETVQILESNGFKVYEAETFRPAVDFADFDQFMEFGYQGGWFTPLIEAVGLQNAGVVTRWLLNRFVFPVQDHHDISLALARKLGQ
jgi:ubiquinone/menaquinone biosynthesis C-methylase UbiE